MPETFPLKRDSISTPLTSRFEASADALYEKINIRDQGKVNGLLKFGFNEPYYWTGLNDSSFLKNMKKFDSQVFPIGSTAQDVVRVGKFATSGRGLIFITKQLMLQKENAFNETRIYNPLSILGSVTKSGLLGVAGNPTRHIEVASTIGGTIKNAVLGGLGLGNSLANKEKPPGVAYGDRSDLVTKYAMTGAGNPYKGLVRSQTAIAARTNFSEKWLDTKKTAGNSLLTTFTNKLKSLIPTTTAPTADWKIRVEYSDTSNVYESMVEAKNNLRFTTYDGDSWRSQDVHKYFPRVDGRDTLFYYPLSKQVVGSTGPDERLKKLHSLLESGEYNPNQYYYDSKNPTVPRSILRSSLNTDNGLIKGYKDIKPDESYATKLLQSGVITIKDRKLATTLKKAWITGGDAYNRLGVLDGVRGREPGELLCGGSGVESVDMVYFYFFDIVNSKYIPFRATVGSINENNSADWEEISYICRPDKAFVYRGFSRDLNFNFSIHTQAIEEQRPIWERINYLIGLTRPSGYTEIAGTIRGTEKFMIPPLVALRLGDMYVDQPMLLNNVGLTVPEDSPWEISRTKTRVDFSRKTGAKYLHAKVATPLQLPFYLSVSVSCKLLDKTLPQTSENRFFPAVK